MHDVYVSCYVDRSLPDLVQDLGSAHRDVGALSVDTGVPVRVHDWMWLVPVEWHRGDTSVVRGHIRVMAVAGGRRAVTELLLVGERTEAGELDLDALVRDLVEEIPRTTAGSSAGQAA